jgi:ATP-dependent exoDNAse (exonuclease V) alpha subunit
MHPENKVVFVGDRFQLPPVGSDHSPALDASKVKALSGMNTVFFELTEVKRQEASSLVLQNAQKLRRALEEESHVEKLKYPIFANADQACDYFVKAFNDDPQSIGFIGWRNEDVYQMNQAIRQKLWGERPSILQAGDLIMVNRTYTDEEDTLLPNGEFGVIQEIKKFEEVAGLRFAQATITFENQNGYKFNHSCKLLLDTLTNASAFVEYEKSKALYGERIRRNKLFRRTKDKRFDRDLNALQVRYGVVVTCHKAQGGEWNEVIIHPRVPPKSSTDHARWLYTAITRARTQFYSFKPLRK